MAKTVATIEMGAAESLIPADAYDTAYAYMGINMTSGGNPVLPTKPSTPAPTKPSTPTPTKPSNPVPSNGGSTNVEGGSTNAGGGVSNLDQGSSTTPAPAPSGNGKATNWLLWGGLAVALGTGGYLIYNYYANPKGKKK